MKVLTAEECVPDSAMGCLSSRRRVMMRYLPLAVLVLPIVSPASAQQADPTRGQRQYQNCNACHSLEPNKNLSGPSLSGVFGRKAGSLPSFTRYSDALKS